MNITSYTSARRRFATFFLMIVLPGISALPVYGTEGHQLIGIGALQKGTAGAGVANPKDSTWVLLNPASIIDLDTRFDFSFEVFAPYRYIDPDGPDWLPMANQWAGKMSDDSIFFIPALGAVFPKGDHAWGIGMFAVNGMGVDYEHSRTLIPRLFGKNFDRRTEYGVMKLAVAYAQDLGDDWTLGASLNLDYARFKSDMLTLHFWETEGGNRWDDAFGVGLTLGIYKTWDRWRFGAAYTTPQFMEVMDKYDDLLPDPLNLPQTFQTGISFDITPALTLSTDYKFLDWSGVDQIGRAPIEGGFGWKDQHVIKAGLTWAVHPRWTLRGGVAYGASPIDEEGVFTNALFPAIVEWHATAGVTYAVNEHTDIHVAYKHAFGNTLTDSGRGDLFSLAGKGTEIHLEENSVTIEYSYKF